MEQPEADVEPGDDQLSDVQRFIEQHAPCRAGEVLQGLGLDRNRGSYLLKQLVKSGRIRVEGQRAGTRYFPAGDVPRPSEAPEPESASAPITLPGRRGSGGRNDAAREAHNALRDRLRSAVVELVRDSEPILGGEIDTMLMEQIPEAEAADLRAVKQQLVEAGTLDRDSRDRYIIPSQNGGHLVTDLERRVHAACLAAPLTASEISLNLDPPVRRMTVTTVLEALARRGVLEKSRNAQVATYCLPEVAAA